MNQEELVIYQPEVITTVGVSSSQPEAEEHHLSILRAVHSDYTTIRCERNASATRLFDLKGIIYTISAMQCT